MSDRITTQLSNKVSIVFNDDFTQVLACNLINAESFNTERNFGTFNNIKTWDIPLPNLINGTKMFSRSSLTSFNLDLPKLNDAYLMFYNCTALISFNSELPNLVNGTKMFNDCTNLETFNSDLSKLTNGDSMFFECYSLTSFNSALPVLNNGSSMFRWSKLPAPEINKILSTLPIVTGNHTITFTGCPGASTCDQTIGTSKGWTVQV